jgi:hypothetical protein
MAAAEPVGDGLSGSILLADLDYANHNTTLLSDAGIRLVVELQTPTPVPTGRPTATAIPTSSATPTPVALPSITPPALSAPSPTQSGPQDQGETPAGGDGADGQSDDTGSRSQPGEDDKTPASAPDGQDGESGATSQGGQTGATTITESTPLTATKTPTATLAAAPALAQTATLSPTVTPTPTATPTPIEVTYLVGDDGLRLLASETVLVLRDSNSDGAPLVAVLGSDGRAISAGVDRLLARNFSECIVGDGVTLCPLAATPESGGSSGGGANPQPGATPGAGTTPDGSQTPAPTGTPAPGGVRVLLIDDDARSQPGEVSEADLYLQVLSGIGASPTLWSTASKGPPTAVDMSPYKWVIWSSGGYAESEIEIELLDQFFQYLNQGGRMTMSSQKPFFGMGIDPASPVMDVVKATDAPQLVTGLPEGPIALEGDRTNVVPLAQPEGPDGFDIVLKRGPASEAADAPIVIAADDSGEPEAMGARLVVAGMSLTWLPLETSRTLIANMAAWMLE